jgi:hypothetical protein
LWRHRRSPITPIVIGVVIGVGVGVVVGIIVGIVRVVPPVRITPPTKAISPIITRIATSEPPMMASATSSVASTTMTPGINGLH